MRDLLSFSFHTRGSGRVRMARSVMMAEAAFAIQVPTWSMQWPGSFGYHNFWTDTQMKTNKKVMHITQAMTKGADDVGPFLEVRKAEDAVEQQGKR